MDVKPNYYYYLYHNVSETMIEKLSWTQLNGFLRVIDEQQWSDFQVWIANINQWVAMQDFIEHIMDNQHHGLIRLPPTPDEDVTRPHQLIDTMVEQRNSTRYEVELPMFIDLAGTIINTTTADISLGGIRFQNVIPMRKVRKVCYVYYRFDAQLIEFQARPIADDDESSFIRVEIISCNHLNMWTDILAKYDQCVGQTGSEG